MPSTYSPSLRIELISAGEQSGTWGTTTNTNLGTLLEQSISGVQAITMSDADYTLSNYNGVSDEARKAVLVVSGTNAAIRDVIVPLVTKAYTIRNNTTGGFAINIRAATGASVSVPNGGTSLVYCDGTNFNLAVSQTVIAAGYGISIATVGSTTTITNSIFPAGTRSPFAQAAAPTGWTQDTSDNATNRMLRVVNTTGNGIGGSASPILNNVVSSHTHTFTGNALANHTHTDSGHQHSNGAIGVSFNGYQGNAANGRIDIISTGVGYANISSVSAGTPSGSISANGSASDWTPRYIDMIICAKN